MGVVRGADDHQIRPRFGQHPVDIAIDRRIAGDHRAGSFRAQGIRIGYGDEIYEAAPTGEKVPAPHGGAAIAGADQRKTTFVIHHLSRNPVWSGAARPTAKTNM
ncbi:hypothetical protein EFR01_20850 [Sinorhizobium fredii]|nr:hypothetical protein EFR01_20850 [Sinorhizobium fredii]GLS07723.1 hypothetical protein GCM10007864_13500 [Sinorhizobium fredii]